MNEEKTYRNLQRHMNQFPLGYPSTPEGVEIEILKEVFTPDEARLAQQISFIPVSLATIRRKLLLRGRHIPDLASMLDTMYKKGTLYRFDRQEKRSYSLAMFAIGFFEYQLNRMSEPFARNAKAYLESAYSDELIRTRIPQLRTIPIQKSLRAEHCVASYDDVTQIIKAKKSTFAIANCICRQTGDLNNTPCHHTDLRETCLLFDHVADHWIDLGIARRASKEECLALLETAQDAGLVLQPTSTLNPSAICCCCGCCCGLLQAARKSPRPADVVGSNYCATIDETACNGCQRCLKHCHTKAIIYAAKKCRVDPARCIGCGTCVPLCKAQAIGLQKKTREFIPLRSLSMLYTAILQKKSGMLGVIKAVLSSWI